MNAEILVIPMGIQTLNKLYELGVNVKKYKESPSCFGYDGYDSTKLFILWNVFKSMLKEDNIEAEKYFKPIKGEQVWHNTGYHLKAFVQIKNDELENYIAFIDPSTKSLIEEMEEHLTSIKIKKILLGIITGTYTYCHIWETKKVLEELIDNAEVIDFIEKLSEDTQEKILEDLKTECENSGKIIELDNYYIIRKY